MNSISSHRTKAKSGYGKHTPLQDNVKDVVGISKVVNSVLQGKSKTGEKTKKLNCKYYLTKMMNKQKKTHRAMERESTSCFQAHMKDGIHSEDRS